MSLITINKTPTPSQLRQFGCLWFPAFCGLLWWLTSRELGFLALLYTLFAVSAFLIGALHPRALRWLFVGWMVLAFPIGWVVSHVVLATIFYLVITSLALALRLLGYDTLQRRLEPEANTYWHSVRQAKSTADYFRQS